MIYRVSRKKHSALSFVTRAVFCTITIGSLFLPTAIILAQTTPTPQRFNPSATISNSGRSFSGVSFSGVGGAIAGCTNLGGTISGGISSLTSIFKNKKPTTENTPIPRLSDSPAINDIRNNSGMSAQDIANLGASRDLSKPAGVANVQNPLTAIKKEVGAEKVPVIATKTDEELAKANKRENCLNGAAYALAKSLLQQVTEKTINWVNTGFNGNPLYVRDLDSFMKSISDQQVSLFLDRIPSQDPVFGYSIRSIVSENLTGISDGLLNEVMDTPQARSYQSFQDDFKNGGWQAFLNPANNPIEAIFNAADDLGSSITSQQENAKTQLQNGNGFLDLQRCVEYADTSAAKYPYSYKGYSCQRDIKSEADKNYAKCIRERGEWDAVNCRAEITQMYNPAMLTSCIKTLRVTADSNSNKQCLRYETVTPGSIIRAQVAEVTTSPVRQLEQADQINEVLGAFFDQLLNRILSEGLSSIRGGVATPSNLINGYGSNVVLGSNGLPLASASYGTSALGYVQSGSGYAGDFDVSRPQHIRAALQTQYDYLSTILDARATLNKIVPTVGALDYCIPGPNPTWTERLDTNVSSFFGSLQELTRENSGLGATIGGTVGSAVGILATTGTLGLGSVLTGLVGGLASTIGGLLGSLFEGKPHSVISAGVVFEDKVTQTTVPARSILFRAKGNSIDTIITVTKKHVENLLNEYETTFTFEKVAQAFINIDPTNAQYVQGFLADSYEETANLPAYASAAIEIDAFYEANDTATREALAKLEAIYSEANDIVTIAKARYIREQAAAGTPVNQTCIDGAYQTTSTPIVPRPRQESSARSPLFDQFIEANNYFYNNL